MAWTCQRCDKDFEEVPYMVVLQCYISIYERGEVIFVVFMFGEESMQK